MTREELKEMVDATINGNGTRNITGDALNLALNAIIDSMGEQKPESAGMVTLVCAELDDTGEKYPEQYPIHLRNLEIFNELTTKFFANDALPIVQIKFYTDYDKGEANSQTTLSDGNASVFILQPTAMKIYEDKIRFLIPALHKQVDNNYTGNFPRPDEPAAANIFIDRGDKVLEMTSDGYWYAYTYPYMESSDSSYV